MLAALRLPDVRLLLTGGLISTLGSWLLVVAVPYYVFRLTGSPAATGITVGAASLPALLVGPVAGVFVDRWSKRAVMISTDLLCAVALLGIPFADRPDRVWLLYAAVFAENLGSVFFRPARRALWPAVVGTGPMLAGANSASAAAEGIVQLAGPPLGALLFIWFGMPVVVVLDMASYVVSAMLIALVRTRAAGESSGRTRVVAELVAGLRFTWDRRLLRGLMAVSFGFFAANAVFTALLIPFMTVRFGGRPGVLGVQLSALGAGFLLGGPLAGKMVDRLATRTALMLGLLGVGLCFGVLANAPTVVVAIVSTGLAGLPGALLLVTIETTIQRTTPGPLLGRTGAVFFASDAAAELGGAVVGALFGGHAVLSVVLTISACGILGCAVLAPILVPRSADGDHHCSIRGILSAPGSRLFRKFAGQRPSSGGMSKSPERPGI